MNKKELILVFPRFKYPNGDMPIGLANLAAMVKSKIRDVNISLIDGGFKSLNFVKEAFRRKRPGVVGIYMDSLMYENAIKVSNIAKNYGANVIIGGPHPTLFPEAVISADSVDAVCTGEGENVLPQYVESYYDGKFLSKIRGILFKSGKDIIRTDTQGWIENLDMIPRLDLDIFEVEDYIKNWIYMNSYNPGLRGISIIASRGCSFNCSYCQPVLDTMFGKKLRICSPEKVANDLLYWRDRYKLRAFYFQDDNLTLFKDWLKEFCNLVLKKRLDMVWGCNSRVDTINPGLLSLLEQAGCKKIRFGIETASDRVLNTIYNKRINLNMAKEAINITKKNNIQASGYFILGGLTESKREIRDTIDFASRSGLDEAVFTIFSPLPGTHLYNQAISKGWNLPKRFEDFNYNMAKRPKIISSDISGEDLNFYKKIAFLKFYCHPKRLRETVATILNRHGLVRAIRSLRTYF